jgi:hypothetical protein
MRPAVVVRHLLRRRGSRHATASGVGVDFDLHVAEAAQDLSGLAASCSMRPVAQVAAEPFGVEAKEL